MCESTQQPNCLSLTNILLCCGKLSLQAHFHRLNGVVCHVETSSNTKIDKQILHLSNRFLLQTAITQRNPPPFFHKHNCRAYNRSNHEPNNRICSVLNFVHILKEMLVIALVMQNKMRRTMQVLIEPITTGVIVGFFSLLFLLPLHM